MVSEGAIVEFQALLFALSLLSVVVDDFDKILCSTFWCYGLELLFFHRLAYADHVESSASESSGV